MDECIYFTRFESLTKPIGKETKGSMTAFIDMVKRRREIAYKKDATLLSPALFSGGKPRGTATALSVQFLVLDVDNAQATGKNPKVVTMEAMASALKDAGVWAVLATSFSHTPAIPRFRVFVFLHAPVPAAAWSRFAPAALAHLGLTDLVFGIDMKALKDCAHIYFLPSCPIDGIQESVVVAGDRLDPKVVHLGPNGSLMAHQAPTNAAEAPASDPPEDLSIYQGDLRTLRLLHLLAATGIEVVTNSAGYHYFECPWQAEHSHPGGVSAWVRKRPNHLPRFACWHETCAGRGLSDLLATFKPSTVDAHCQSLLDPTEPYDPSEIGKPEIIMDFNLERTVDRCIEVLADSGVVFCRGDVLVDLPGYMEYLRGKK